MAKTVELKPRTVERWGQEWTYLTSADCVAVDVATNDSLRGRGGIAIGDSLVYLTAASLTDNPPTAPDEVWSPDGKRMR